MTAASLVIQLLLAATIIWMNWDVIDFTTWSDDENRALFAEALASEYDGMEMIQIVDQSSQALLGENGQIDGVTSRSRTSSRSRTADEERDVD